MPAKVLKIHVKPGDSVSLGTVVATIESMKMEMPLEAESPGVVSAVLAEPNATVPKGAVLVVID